MSYRTGNCYVVDRAPCMHPQWPLTHNTITIIDRSIRSTLECVCACVQEIISCVCMYTSRSTHTYHYSLLPIHVHVYRSWQHFSMQKKSRNGFGEIPHTHTHTHTHTKQTRTHKASDNRLHIFTSLELSLIRSSYPHIMTPMWLTTQKS